MPPPRTGADDSKPQMSDDGLPLQPARPPTAAGETPRDPPSLAPEDPLEPLTPSFQPHRPRRHPCSLRLLNLLPVLCPTSRHLLSLAPAEPGPLPSLVPVEPRLRTNKWGRRVTASLVPL